MTFCDACEWRSTCLKRGSCIPITPAEPEPADQQEAAESDPSDNKEAP